MYLHSQYAATTFIKFHTFHHLKRKICTHELSVPIQSSCKLLANSNLLSVHMDLPILDCHLFLSTVCLFMFFLPRIS